MSRNQYVLIPMLAVAAGLLGGLVSRDVFAPTAVLAQARPRGGIVVPNILRAREIELVDESGRMRGLFTIDPDGNAKIRLYDTQGRVTWESGRTGALPLWLEKIR